MTSESNEEIVVPLHEEGVSIAKKRVVTGPLRISTVTHQEEALVDETLTQENVEVERTAVNRFVDRMPSVREEGETLVIPIVEEILRVERRLLLKEEVRVRRTWATRRHEERVKIRKQHAIITRLPIE
jgi:stress response protein YsnF